VLRNTFQCSTPIDDRHEFPAGCISIVQRSSDPPPPQVVALASSCLQHLKWMASLFPLPKKMDVSKEVSSPLPRTALACLIHHLTFLYYSALPLAVAAAQRKR